MKGRNLLRVSTDTIKEAMEAYFEDLLEAENVHIDSIEEIEDDDLNVWFQLVLEEN